MTPGQELIWKLHTMERELQRWMDFDRSRGGGETPDSAIMAPPTWPTHGMLQAWEMTLREAQLRISQSE